MRRFLVLAAALGALACAPALAGPRQLAELPNIDVNQRVVHAVPDDSAMKPAQPITIVPSDPRFVERAAPVPSARRARASHVSLTPATLDGPARIAGGAALSVSGQTVRLFGVRPPGQHDRCAQPAGGAAPCADAAQARLAARLGPGGHVACTMPPGQERDIGFLCRDAAGTDLGAMLVSEGLALADTASSFQYLAAQETARLAKRGMWSYR
jgi:endonuclease YncB( thermonuclease family)